VVGDDGAIDLFISPAADPCANIPGDVPVISALAQESHYA